MGIRQNVHVHSYIHLLKGNPLNCFGTAVRMCNYVSATSNYDVHRLRDPCILWTTAKQVYLYTIVCMCMTQYSMRPLCGYLANLFT